VRRAGLSVVQTLLPFFGCRDASVVIRFCCLVLVAWEPVGRSAVGNLALYAHTDSPVSTCLDKCVGYTRRYVEKASQEPFVVGCLVVPIATCQSCRLTPWLQCNISATIILGSMLGSIGFHIQLTSSTLNVLVFPKTQTLV
jgi:hypothetical protein